MKNGKCPISWISNPINVPQAWRWHSDRKVIKTVKSDDWLHDVSFENQHFRTACTCLARKSGDSSNWCWQHQRICCAVVWKSWTAFLKEACSTLASRRCDKHQSSVHAFGIGLSHKYNCFLNAMSMVLKSSCVQSFVRQFVLWFLIDTGHEYHFQKRT